jgi:NitT/TauT family transport system substrate-binding protein
MTDHPPPRQVRIRLLWHRQAQFAGYLLAEQDALGAARGIGLHTSPIDFNRPGLDALAAGEVEFAVASPSHLLESRHAPDLAMVLTVQQDSALVYPASRARGIEALADLAGRRVGVWPGHEDLELRWMLLRAGLAPDSVIRVPMQDTIGPFLAGEIDCAQMTVYHEYRRVVEALGGAGRVTTLRAADQDAALIKDGLFTTRRLLQDAPQTVQAVVDTVLEGWAIAFADNERAVAACLRADPALTRADQTEQLRAIAALARSGPGRTHGLGYPDPEHMRRAALAMEALGLVVPPGIDGATETGFWLRSPSRTAPTG